MTFLAIIFATFGITAMFFGLSFTRSYVLRRIFARLA